jgi:hydrolase, TatD family
MKLIDSHCHIHDQQYDFDINETLSNAKKAGIGQIVTVGTDVEDSRAAVDFAEKHDNVYALIGIHPGITKPNDVAKLEEIIKSNPKKLVGFGDIGLDYHYKPFNKALQIKLLRQQLKLAKRYDLPASFHVREAFDDFWAIIDELQGIRGTLHSYTDNLANMEQALSRGLYISINGIVSFNKEPELEQVFCSVPIEKILLETDAPYLAPKPHRGKINQPAYVADIAKILAEKRNISVDEIAKITTDNAQKLFLL